MKYKVGDKVRIKSIDWYNEHTLIDTSGVFRTSIESLCLNKKRFMGKELTICSVLSNGHYLMEETGVLRWTDEMIEGLVEDLLDKEIQEHQKICDEALTIKGIEPTEEVWHCPEGYQFVDENGNVINAQKIILEKKGKRYPKTYDECCRVLGIEARDFDILYNMLDTSEKNYCNNLDRLLNTFRKLLICRDAYWKIAGEEMGLGKPWKPDWENSEERRHSIVNIEGDINLPETTLTKWILKVTNKILVFPTLEMRDAFYENFKELIESVKELL